MQIISYYIVVKVKSIWNDEVEFDGGGDHRSLMINPFHHTAKYIKECAEVVAVPFDLPYIPINQDSTGLPHYDEDPPLEWKRVSDIKQEIEAGDKVYFHYSCLDRHNHINNFNANHLYSDKEMENGKMTWFHYFRVKYDLVIAIVRYEPANKGSDKWSWSKEGSVQKVDGHGFDGEGFELYSEKGSSNLYRKKVIMVGSWTFVEPDMETWENILYPVQETGQDGKPLLAPNGKPIFKPKEKWIAMKASPGEKGLQGWVRFVGAPLKGDHDDIKPGMYIHFHPKADTKLEFEGKPYFRMMQRHIHLIAEKIPRPVLVEE